MLSSTAFLSCALRISGAFGANSRGRTRVPLKRAVDSVPKQEMLDDMGIVRAFNVQC